MKIEISADELEVLTFLLRSSIEIAEEMAKQKSLTSAAIPNYFHDVKAMRKTLEKLLGAK